MEIQQKDVWARGETTSLSDYFKKTRQEFLLIGTGDTGTVPMRPQENTDRTTGGKKKKVSSVSQSASIIQAHIKQLMCIYSIVLSSAGCYRGEKKILLLSLNKSIHANGREWTNM